jgi:hypothetical protein
MPADYLAVRDSCFERVKKKKGYLSKKDEQKCKRMAVIWWIKKHGKPFPKEEGKVILEKIPEEVKADLEEVFDEYILQEDNVRIFDLSRASVEASIKFNAPLTKSDAEYRKVDSPDEVPCERCLHFIHGIIMYPDYSRLASKYGFCHLVAGLIDVVYTCKYATTDLVEEVTTSGDNVSDLPAASISVSNGVFDYYDILYSIYDLEDVGPDKYDVAKKVKVDEPKNNQFFRVRINDPKKYDQFAIIDIDKKKGIRAVLGVYKEGGKKKSEIQAFLFSKDKKFGWTKEKVIKWIKQHVKEFADSSEGIESLGNRDGTWMVLVDHNEDDVEIYSVAYCLDGVIKVVSYIAV